MCELLI